MTGARGPQYRFEFDGRGLTAEQRQALRMRGPLANAPNVLPAVHIKHGMITVQMRSDQTAKKTQLDIEEMTGHTVRLVRLG